ncbi:hypothetical protein Q7P37_007353 [Cladosporium fusiforme]
MPTFGAFFSRPWAALGAATILRVVLLFYGRWQDANSPVKYTDIDYLVFTDASRFLAHNQSPYDRATYRYTPLLAWLLYPTTWGSLWFEFGKALFAAGDVVTGWLIFCILRGKGMDCERSMKFASIWLLNPMVANISTRGSSEGLVVVVVVALLWAALQQHIILAGFLLGFGVHFKIYPFIYAASIFWWLGGLPGKQNAGLIGSFLNRERVILALSSFFTFMLLNAFMFMQYGEPFVEHSFTYHLSRLDHRHNFSIYNTLLHLSSQQPSDTGFHIESLAFVPQILLSLVMMPLLLAKKDLASTMLAQTFAFVTFNKVCTSQYFLWYMVFLPFYLPNSSLLQRPALGISALTLWIVGQALWLQQGFELEFLGNSTFVPGLWLASATFFCVNCWILGLMVEDIRAPGSAVRHKKT